MQPIARAEIGSVPFDALCKIGASTACEIVKGIAEIYQKNAIRIL